MSTIASRRINNEIKDFNNKKYYGKYKISPNILKFIYSLSVEQYILNIDNIDNNHIKIYTNQNNKKILDLKIPNNYPFKNYIIYDYNFLNNNFTYHPNYNKYLVNISEKIKNYDKKILNFFFKNQFLLKSKFLTHNKNDCFCCNSVTCYEYWQPSNTFFDILIEYNEIKFILEYSDFHSYNNLVYIYNNLFNNVLEKLPQEIIDKIFDYIK